MMDSARDFDLLGESVPQVRVSARTLALLGFFPFVIYSDSLLSGILYLSSLSTLEGGVLKRLTACPSAAGKNISERTLEGSVSRVSVTSSDDSRVDRIACDGSPSLSHLFLRMVQWRDG